jgi:hypothetical protein
MIAADPLVAGVVCRRIDSAAAIPTAQAAAGSKGLRATRVWEVRTALIHRALDERRALRHDTHVGIGLGLAGRLEIDIDDDRLRLTSPSR